jgi:transcriptional regulator with XRE-family HTH domain
VSGKQGKTHDIPDIPKTNEDSISNHKVIFTEEATTFAQRLKSVIGQCSMTSFAQQCNLSESAIRKYIRGDSEPTLQNLLVICEVGKVSLSWLATGKPDGNLLTATPEKLLTHTPTPSFDQIVINEVNFYSLAQEQLQYIPKSHWILSRRWILKEGLQNANLAFTCINCENLTQVARKGDLALINIKPQGWKGALEGVFIICLHGNILIKRLQYDPIKHGYCLYSDNSHYRDHFIDINQPLEYKIIAKIEHVLTRIF